MIGNYAKALAAALVALSAWAGTALPDGHVTGTEWVALITAVTTPTVVWLVPNATASSRFNKPGETWTAPAPTDVREVPPA